ncbi:glycoside hydrolase family 43 protein [Martelella sp. HB161492]|uniref:glycoside hydrolase family 43 protein n=1 Tax=Martelella sp. HB161492 TaxID=2720726 RepID=UPI00159180B7|nr:glycoside hydrolase family 43 protein [Martelella sp. HB161492]
MTIHNPILRGFNPDPSICRVGKTFYIATSTFEWFPGVQIHASEDLSSWKLVSRPLTRPEQLDMLGNPDSCGVWAPCLSYADGQFWLIYTNVRRHQGNYKDTPNFLVTAPSIEGPWSDPIPLNSSGFDPSLFHDDDGRKWLVNQLWDHRATMPGRDEKDYFGGIVLQEYDPVAKRLIGPVKKIFERSQLGRTEGPHLMKRKGWYYLVLAEGGTGYTHAVTHARSRTIEGPYALHPDVHLLSTKDAPESPLQRVGHGQVVEAEDGTVWHSFLCTRPIADRRSQMGRETGIEKMVWGDDGWLRRAGVGVVPSTTIEAGKSEQADASETVTFDGPALPMAFQWLRTPHPERLFSLTARPGRLRLFGRESVGSWFEQSLVARRMTEHSCSAETEVEFSPETYQQQAGLIAYYGRYQFHYAYVTLADNGTRRLSIQSCNGDFPTAVLTFPIGEGIILGEGPVSLRLDVVRETFQFSFRQGDADWQKLGPALDALVLADESGPGDSNNFTGTFLGMCAQDLSGSAQVADFSYFAYRTGE